MPSSSTKGTVLVLGGGGFLGSHTADVLSDSGYKVRIFDRAASPYLRPDQEMVVGDIADLETLKKAAAGCEAIYHFAGIADIEEAGRDAIQTVQVNIIGTLNVLEAARAAQVKRFVFASTVYVYSSSGGFYRISKQACENLIEEYQRLYGLSYTILRYGSLYGRRAGSTNGIYNLICKAMQNGEIVYNGDPDAMREYIHVNDAATLSVEILDQKYENSHLVLTGPERMRVADLMRMIAEMMPNKPAFRFGDRELVAHYTMTPYTYNPRVGHKLVSPHHIDLGQGILDCIAEIYDQADGEKPQKVAQSS